MNGLQITDVQVWPLKNPKPGTKLKANCRVTFNDVLTVNGKLWDGRNGFFVGAYGQYGDKKTEDGSVEKVFYSAWSVKRESQEIQEQMKAAVLQEYNKHTGGSSYNSNQQNTNQQQNMNQQPNSSQFGGADIPF